MIIKRENYKLIILEPAKSRITRNECAACALPKEQWGRRNKRWSCCSTNCTSSFKEKYLILGWQDLRLRAFKRDRYRCVKCAVQPLEIIQRLDPITNKWDGTMIPSNTPDPTHLIGDHIIPIALGGDEWDINNVQTLCQECNKEKTRIDAGRIAVERRVSDNQKKL